MSVYDRESSTGASTTAYFFGKSIAQLPVSLIAPGLFLITFNGLGILRAPFWNTYLLLVITYIHFAGVGYFISLVAPSGVTQLAAIFLILFQMMFGGAHPSLNQLKSNALLGYTLFQVYVSLEELQ